MEVKPRFTMISWRFFDFAGQVLRLRRCQIRESVVKLIAVNMLFLDRRLDCLDLGNSVVGDLGGQLLRRTFSIYVVRHVPE